MSTGIFKEIKPSVDGNPKLRDPQRETFSALTEAAKSGTHREVGIVLPVGCGKSGCITLAPFAFKATRALVVAPGVPIASQLYDDFDPTKPNCFYLKTGAITGDNYPEPVKIKGTTANRGDLDEADVVITNIQQLQGENNRWLNSLPKDYFNLILFDEGHHSVATTWETLKSHFPSASIVNFSATPLRADGQKMAGEIIYSYPIFRAIQEGYVKRLKALVLNPRTLKYVRQEDGQEIEVSLEEVKRLGEEDADFRRSIVTSTETLNTIVDASIRELDRIREKTEDNRHKIIASALNYEHCHQIVEAYRSRGKKTDYVHSREDSKANDSVIAQLENHELDVIVQVRKLGEGFDHPYLSVAAVFSIFANLSPFVQFVGRIMRVIAQNNPQSPLNQGTVVFHAGANIAQRWEDFQEYSEADQEFFDQLLPVENLDFSSSDELSVIPREMGTTDSIEVREQTDVLLEEIPLIQNDPEAMKAINILREKGYSPEQVQEAMRLEPVPTTKIRERQAKRSCLDGNISNETGKILAQRKINPKGYDLDKRRLGRTNFVVLKAAIDRKINDVTGRGNGQRHEFNRAELEMIEQRFSELVESATNEVFNAAP
ncbi:MAG: DEAD/DEAH box helicase [Candidatus Electrothrix sp. LOE2]|jgi:superfamily II DNA or RNA helicase|nr:DEAD/DEAH box helicase [Candidatus Electrothrix sp. LOE2]